MGVKIIKQFAIAWNIMWAFSYLVVAFLAPNIGGGSTTGNMLIFLAFGIALLSATVLTSWTKGTMRTAGRILLVILAIISVASGVASWTGVALWNVPFANKELFQVSMAFADLIGAVFMLDLTLEKNIT
jgi:hypothetical protein